MLQTKINNNIKINQQIDKRYNKYLYIVSPLKNQLQIIQFDLSILRMYLLYKQLDKTYKLILTNITIIVIIKLQNTIK